MPTSEGSVLAAASQLRQAEAFGYLSTQLARKGRHSLGLLVSWRSLSPNQCPAYLLLVLCQRLLLLDKMPSKAKEFYLPFAKGLLALAKGATPDSGGRERPHSRSRLKLCLSYSSARYYYYYHIIFMFHTKYYYRWYCCFPEHQAISRSLRCPLLCEESLLCPTSEPFEVKQYSHIVLSYHTMSSNSY